MCVGNLPCRLVGRLILSMDTSFCSMSLGLWREI